MLFAEALLESIFGARSADEDAKGRLLVPFRIVAGPEFEIDTRSDHFHLKRWPGSPSILSWHYLCRDPPFHETIVITVPFGPSGVWKVSLSIEIASFSI